MTTLGCVVMKLLQTTIQKKKNWPCRPGPRCDHRRSFIQGGRLWLVLMISAGSLPFHLFGVWGACDWLCLIVFCSVPCHTGWTLLTKSSPQLWLRGAARCITDLQTSGVMISFSLMHRSKIVDLPPMRVTGVFPLSSKVFFWEENK